MKTNRRKLLLILTALLVLAAAGAGAFFLLQGSGEPVNVYAFEFLGMTEYWGDSQESYGPVTTDRIQTVFLTDTQTVTEVKTEAGAAVKKGDILFSYDTTLSGLQLERKRLEVEKLQLQLKEAENTLQEIRNMKPMEEPIFPPDAGGDAFLGAEITQPYRAFLIDGNDGTTMAKPFICWIRDDTPLNDALYEELRRKVWGDWGMCEHDNLEDACPICNPVICEHGEIQSQCVRCNCTHGPDCAVCNPPRCVHDRLLRDCPICSPAICGHGEIEALCPVCTPPTCIHGPYCPICYCPHGNLPDSCEECNPPQTQPTEGTAADSLSHADGGYRVIRLSNDSGTPNHSYLSYHVVFKITAGNMELGATTFWQGVHVTGQGDAFSLSYFTPSLMDYTIPPVEEEAPQPLNPGYFGSGYTAGQIAEMRSEQEKKIKELDLQTKMAEAEYKIMLREVGDGNVYAEFDGTVVSLLTEEEAKSARQPMVKVSGGGGFYIEGSVSELEKDKLLPGQEVTVNDWNTGMMYTGTVKSIGDFPASGSGWSGMGNPNATYYPFTVFVGDDADLQEGAYVSIQYSTSAGANGIYLDKAFLRTEQGSSYVYLRGADGYLEKRYVTTGKSLWGSYMEILSGLTAEDFLAFPYGKNVKEGAKAVESDISSLYSY